MTVSCPNVAKVAACCILAWGTSSALHAQTNGATPVDLDQRVRILERKLEVAEEAAAAKAAEASVVTAGKDGFSLTSADKAFQLKLRGTVQADARFFVDDGDQKATDSFLMRRVRPVLEGKLHQDFDYRIMTDFGSGATALQDAWLGYAASPALKVRAGKYRPPFGLENLQAASDLMFVERGLPTGLVPVRDVGLQVFGDWYHETVSYAVGVFNGVPDGAAADSDGNDSKDVVGRLMVSPFKATDIAALAGLSAGVAVSMGDQGGTPAAPNLPSYKSIGQQSIFSYRSSTNAADAVYADGGRVRVSPQALYYFKSLGVLAEYVQSEQDVNHGGSVESLANEAWQVAASIVLTGEDASYKGVNPRKPFAPGQGQWGAVELAARYQELSMDDQAFAGYADPKKSVKGTETWGVGVNWYLNRNYKLVANFDHSTFDAGASKGDRPDEDAVFTRLQVVF